MRRQFHKCGQLSVEVLEFEGRSVRESIVKDGTGCDNKEFWYVFVQCS